MIKYYEQVTQVKPMITNAVAAAALVSPVWLPWLDKVSELAALMIPILGAIWLITQISQSWLKWYKRK